MEFLKEPKNMTLQHAKTNRSAMVKNSEAIM